MQYKEEVKLLHGYHIQTIGTHSIWKGAISYLLSEPSGPQAASVCICTGWTMGKVRDTYMRFMDSSDQFVGCCLSLLPLLNSQFACLPPHFASTVTNDVNM